MAASPTTVPDTLVTTYLQMTEPASFRPAYSSDPGVEIVRVDGVDVEFYRFLYNTVGELWRWRDRRLMSDGELGRILCAPGTSVYVLLANDEAAGYVELDRQGQDTEIAYFGLRPEFIGRGLGKHLLSYGIAQAWNDGTRRVWVHTCNLDGEHALNNYVKRGFDIYNVTEVAMPERYL